jgi:1-acyl-sn-glycerol-3-phosphate acyltransferase
VPDYGSSLDDDLVRFTRWARRIRFVGKGLCRTTHTPASVPPSDGRPIVMVANHRSLADVFVAITALDHFGLPARCLVRAKYFETPLVGKWLHAVGCIPAGDGKRGSVDIALETLASGRSVAIMVEGRIIPPEKRDELGLGEFRPGFLEIARAADAVVMPIALLGTDDVWASRGRGPRIPWRGRPSVRVHIGEPIVIDDLSDDEAIEMARKAISGYLDDMG